LLRPKHLKKATAAKIKNDYDNVKKQTKNLLASVYKKYTSLKLTQTEIDRLTNKHIDTFHKELKNIYSGFNTFPTEVRVALYDMIFNLGMTNLKNTWLTFNKHIKAKDWQKPPTIQNEKNLSLLLETSTLKIYLKQPQKTIKRNRDDYYE